MHSISEITTICRDWFKNEQKLKAYNITYDGSITKWGSFDFELQTKEKFYFAIGLGPLRKLTGTIYIVSYDNINENHEIIDINKKEEFSFTKGDLDNLKLILQLCLDKCKQKVKDMP